MRETTNPVLNSDDICRACMKADGILLPMYDGQLGSKNLPIKLAELASIQVRIVRMINKPFFFYHLRSFLNK